MNNYEDVVLENIEEEDKKEFTIDTPNKADWAIEQVIAEQQRFAMYEQVVNSKIEQLKEDLLKEKTASENRTSWLRFKLGDYLHRDDVPAKDTKTQLSLKLPSGSVVFKKSKIEFHKDDKALLEYCKENAKEYVKTETKESVAWGELKKNLVVNDGMVLDGITGEIVEGVEALDSIPKIEVK